MFTGIIEEIGKVVKTVQDGENVHITMNASFIDEIRVDQSIAHNGVCLTVVNIEDGNYTVTAVKETLDRSNLSLLESGDEVNLERCMQLGARLDGHMVQGHVDTRAFVKLIEKSDGSTKYFFEFDNNKDEVTVAKGSITVNGVSLTVVDTKSNGFSVVIIPFTIEHTNFHTFEVGTMVNLEFDIIGKYVARLMENRE